MRSDHVQLGSARETFKAKTPQHSPQSTAAEWLCCHAIVTHLFPRAWKTSVRIELIIEAKPWHQKEGSLQEASPQCTRFDTAGIDCHGAVGG
eukprot:5841470-Amphidinium_carterae.1